jgi:hypothetical protein
LQGATHGSRNGWGNPVYRSVDCVFCFLDRTLFLYTFASYAETKSQKTQSHQPQNAVAHNGEETVAKGD